MTRKLMSVADFAATTPFSESSVRWYVFQAEHNGLARHKAIVRVGRRVYIDPQAFDCWIDAQQPVSPQQAAV